MNTTNEPKEPFTKETFVDFLIDYQTVCRRIIVAEKITEESMSKLRRTLLMIEHRSVHQRKIEPIDLLLDTCGGSVDETNSMGDFFETLHCPVRGIVTRMTSSMGVDLLQKCKLRTMFPHAILYLHFTRYSKFELVLRTGELSKKEIAAIIERYESDYNQRVQFYKDRTGLSKIKVEDLFRNGEDIDSIIFAPKALKLGLIDEIIDPATLKWFDLPHNDSK